MPSKFWEDPDEEMELDGLVDEETSKPTTYQISDKVRLITMEGVKKFVGLKKGMLLDVVRVGMETKNGDRILSIKAPHREDVMMLCSNKVELYSRPHDGDFIFEEADRYVEPEPQNPYTNNDKWGKF